MKFIVFCNKELPMFPPLVKYRVLLLGSTADLIYEQLVTIQLLTNVLFTAVI